MMCKSRGWRNCVIKQGSSIVGREQSQFRLSTLAFSAALSSGMQLTPRNTPGSWLSEKAVFRDKGQKNTPQWVKRQLAEFRKECSSNTGHAKIKPNIGLLWIGLALRKLIQKGQLHKLRIWPVQFSRVFLLYGENNARVHTLCHIPPEQS